MAETLQFCHGVCQSSALYCVGSCGAPHHNGEPCTGHQNSPEAALMGGCGRFGSLSLLRRWRDPKPPPPPRAILAPLGGNSMIYWAPRPLEKEGNAHNSRYRPSPFFYYRIICTSKTHKLKTKKNRKIPITSTPNKTKNRRTKPKPKSTPASDPPPSSLRNDGRA